MKNPVIALVQVAYPAFPTGFVEQISRIRGFIEEARGAEADIVCFPETFFMPPFQESVEYTANHIGPICKENGIWTVIGTSMEQGGLRNSAVILDRSGEVAAIYHKEHLLGGEKDYGIVPGTKPVMLCPSNMVVPIPEMLRRQRQILNSLYTAISAQLNCFLESLWPMERDLSLRVRSYRLAVQLQRFSKKDSL